MQVTRGWLPARPVQLGRVLFGGCRLFIGQLRRTPLCGGQALFAHLPADGSGPPPLLWRP